MFDTIIVPLDGSPHAEAAVPYALAEARQHDAALVLLRIIPRPEPCLGVANRGGPPPLIPTWPRAELLAAEGEAIRYLEDVRRRFGLGGRAEMVVAAGDPLRRLLAEVRQHRRPLVVLTTGDPGVAPAPYLSRIVRCLLAAGTVPVLAVREPLPVPHAAAVGCEVETDRHVWHVVAADGVPHGGDAGRPAGSAAHAGHAATERIGWPSASGAQPFMEGDAP